MKYRETEGIICWKAQHTSLRKRTRKNAGELHQFITCIEQILQVLNNRLSSPNVGVIEEFTPRFFRRMTQQMVVIHRRGVSLFVRRDNVETFAQEVGILIRHCLAGGAVNNDRVQQMIFFHEAN